MNLCVVFGVNVKGWTSIGGESYGVLAMRELRRVFSEGHAF
jgi:hypothetical protein